MATLLYHSFANDNGSSEYFSFSGSIAQRRMAEKMNGSDRYFSSDSLW